MAVRLNKPWCPVTDRAVAALTGQLGVFELADADGQTVYIGCADARSLFGLRSAVADALRQLPRVQAFRVEVTTAYRTRHLELLMAYEADHGVLPRHNTRAETPVLGRLSPG